MSFWTSLRDDVENGALAVADYFTGGAASALGGLRARSAQDSTLGQIVGVGGQLYGLGNLAVSAYNSLSNTAAANGGSSDWLSKLWGGGTSGASNGTGAYTANGAAYNNPSAFDTTGASGVSTAAPAASTAGSAAGALGGTATTADTVSKIASILGGLSTMQSARQVQANPAVAQIQALQANPGLALQGPGAQAALQAVLRNQAAAGNVGSANLQAALAATGGQLYNEQLSQLAGTAPLYDTQATLANQGNMQGLGMLSSGLSGLNFSGGYGHLFGG